MNCPYCAEKVKDEALACPFCQKDIALFKPVFSRLSKIDHAISELHTAIDVRPARTATSTVDKASVATALSVALATMTCWVTYHYPFYPELLTKLFDKPFNFLSVASPFFAALWFGWSSPRLRATAYLPLGVLPGIMGFVAWFLLHAHYIPPYPDDWRSNLFVYVVSGPLWFLAGGTIGARTKELRAHAPAYPEASSPEDRGKQNSQEMLMVVIKGIFTILVALIPYILHKAT